MRRSHAARDVRWHRCASIAARRRCASSPRPATSRAWRRPWPAISRRSRRMIPPAADPEAFEPRPSDLAKLKGASVVVRVGLGYDHWLDKLLAMHGDADGQSRRRRLCRRLRRHSAARGQRVAASIPRARMGMPMASPIRTIGSIRRMPRSITGGIAEAVHPRRAANGGKNHRQPRRLSRPAQGEVSPDGNSLLAPHRAAPTHRLSQHLALFRAPLSARHRRRDRNQGRRRTKPGAARQACSRSIREQKDARHPARAVRTG